MQGGGLWHGHTVRAAVSADFEAIAAVYRPSVELTAASFELVAPDGGEMQRRWLQVIEARCPYLVAEQAGAVAGFAYARPFHQRAAFAWTVENSVYVGGDHVRQGIGRALLGALIVAASTAGFRQMIALISSDAEAASLPLHAALGFRVAGRLSAVGHKFGHWHDVVHMQRALGAGSETAPLGRP